ncbi:hypothetical protein VKT23_012521 [Stygiomarasmius scandens]|uniref:GPI anchored protein n=1 Tax=Marasmiellus scandens TaxID=2682957 RepID=A0ABR1J6K7_9AGAR
MKYALFVPSFVFLLHRLSSKAAAQTLTLYQVVDPNESVDDSLTEGSPIAIAIGTANDGAATTYRIEDHETDILTDSNGTPTTTEEVTFTVTIAASASGWKITEPAETGDDSDPLDGEPSGGEIECLTPDDQGNGACIVRANFASTTVEVTQTGSMISLIVPISTAGSDDSSSSSSSSGSGSGSTSNGENGNNDNSARGYQMFGIRTLGAVVGTIIFGSSFLY